MKISFSAIAITLFFASFSTINAQGLDFGIQFGYVTSSERLSEGTVAYDIKSMNSFDAGFLLGIQPFRKTGLQIEPTYVRKGSNHYNAFIWEDNNYKLDYISVPVLLTYNPFLNLDLLGGLEFGYLVNLDSRFLDKEYLKKQYNKPAELGLQFGVSYSFFDKIYIGAKYFYGLTPSSSINILDEFGVDNGEDLKSYNKGMMINIGYLIF